MHCSLVQLEVKSVLTVNSPPAPCCSPAPYRCPQGGRAVHLGGTYGIRTGEGPSLGAVPTHKVTIYNKAYNSEQTVEVEVPEDRQAAATVLGSAHLAGPLGGGWVQCHAGVWHGELALEARMLVEVCPTLKRSLAHPRLAY